MIVKLMLLPWALYVCLPLMYCYSLAYIKSQPMPQLPAWTVQALIIKIIGEKGKITVGENISLSAVAVFIGAILLTLVGPLMYVLLFFFLGLHVLKQRHKE
ncbi:MAG: hypothetical protein GY941_21000 [Planctomycetes bacterium]|nr:hypothetical protein [Planctomycetota bacterium]